MEQSLGQDFRFPSLLRFAFPSMVMMVFMSLYTIVDGIFLSRMVGSLALSATNIVYPMINLLFAVGIMLATGGSAVIGMRLGEKKLDKACENLSLLVLVGAGAGIAAMIFGNCFIEEICRMLGATDIIMDYCTSYLSILLYFAPMCMLQTLFQSFFVTAGSPRLGLICILSGGIANIILDLLFMGPMQMGASGAALATGIGQSVPAVAGLLFFFFKKEGLRFKKPVWDKGVLIQSCFNGSSEMVTNISAAVITYLFNIILLRMAGETGVAAITVILYGQFVFVALYIGFGLGVAPVFSYNYGAGNREMLLRIYRICFGFVILSSVIITVLAVLGAPVIAGVFVGRGSEAYEMTRRGNLLFAVNYLFAGYNILASGVFTALSDGKTSAFLSFMRTFGCIFAALMILPELFGIDGVWCAIPVAEFLTVILSVNRITHFFGNLEKEERMEKGKNIK